MELHAEESVRMIDYRSQHNSSWNSPEMMSILVPSAKTWLVAHKVLSDLGVLTVYDSDVERVSSSSNPLKQNIYSEPQKITKKRRRIDVTECPRNYSSDLP